MKKVSIKTLYLFCSIVLSVVALFGINGYIKGKVDPKQVWVFTRDIEANSKISDTDVELIEIPQAAVKTSFFVGSASEVVGKYLNTDAYTDQYVLSKQLITKDEVDPFKSLDTTGLRKIAIPGTMVQTAGPISRGDTIDLLYRGEIEYKGGVLDGETAKYGKVFMQNIPVYEVITGEGTKTTGPNDVPQGVEPNPFYQYIVIAVTIPQAEEILTRMSEGQLSVISRFEDSESYKTPGFAMNHIPSPDKLPFIGEATVEKRDSVLIENDR